MGQQNVSPYPISICAGVKKNIFHLIERFSNFDFKHTCPKGGYCVYFDRLQYFNAHEIV